MGKMNMKFIGKYWICDWVFYLYLFIVNFKNICLIVYVYWKLFDVWIFVLYSKSYFFVCESVVFIYECYV